MGLDDGRCARCRRVHRATPKVVNSVHYKIIREISAKYSAEICGFRKAVRKCIADNYGEDGDSKYLTMTPDAWSIVPDSQDRDILIKVWEVEVSNPISDEKMREYAELWFDLDSSDEIELHLFAVDRYGIEREINLARIFYGIKEYDRSGQVRV